MCLHKRQVGGSGFKWGWRWVLEWRKCDTLMALPSSGSEAFSGPLEWQQQQKWQQQ